MTDRTVLVTVPSEGTSSTVQRAQPGANRDVRTMAPSKRRKMSTSSQMGHVQRTVRTASAQGDLSAPDADLDAEPEELMCPITRSHVPRSGDGGRIGAHVREERHLGAL